jgi:hypothetical protein
LKKLTIKDPFPTLFADEIVNEVSGHECYSFIDGLQGKSSTYFLGISR